MERKVNVAVVGMGYWGPNLVRNLHEVPEAEVSWICDTRSETLDKVAARYPAVQRTSDFARLLEDPDGRGDRSCDTCVHPLRDGGERAPGR